MEKLPADVVRHIALMMDLPEILSLCQSSDRFDNIICKNDKFWLGKLIRDYNISKSDIYDGYTPRTFYEYVKWVIDNKQQMAGLESAISAGNLVLVKLFIDRNNQRMVNNGLDYAVMYDELPIVKYFVELGANVNRPGYYSILSEAVKTKNIDMVRYLVDSGANIHHSDDLALMTAALVGDLEIVRFLVDSGSQMLDDALIKATMHGRTKIVEYLIEKGADVNYDDGEPLFHAVVSGNLDTVKVLINNGVIRDANDLNQAIETAIGNGKLEIAYYLHRIR